MRSPFPENFLFNMGRRVARFSRPLLGHHTEPTTKSVDYCDPFKFPSCCEHVDVFCLFETLECWLECCAQLCSDTGVSSFVFAW